MFNPTALAGCLQALFTTTADAVALAVGFIRRRRLLTGRAVARTLVFHWMANPRASLEDLAAELGVSPQALQQHLGPRSHLFFRQLIRKALQRLHACRLQAQRLGLLQAFPAVIVEDCTTVSLPDGLADLWPGCGGSDGHGRAAVKLLLRYELKSGAILSLTPHPGKSNDAALAATAADLPPGSLYLADLGFFDARRLGQFGSERFWISRIPASVCVRIDGEWQPLTAWLAHARADEIDLPIHLVESVGTACRLTARRGPTEVAARRRQKLRQYTRSKKGREPSARQLAMCDGTVYATNVPAEVLTVKQVWVAYRCRWQIELLFKRAKQMGGWSFTRGRNKDRVLAELWAKVLGLLVLHWGTLLSGGPLGGKSPTKMMRVGMASAHEMAGALVKGMAALVEVLERLAEKLKRIRPQRRRRKNATTRDLLLEPPLAA